MSLTDPPLSKRGERTARRLRDWPGELTFAKVFATPLQCAARTCTGTDDPQAFDVLYINALAAPFTGGTTPDTIMAEEGSGCEDLSSRFTKAGKEAKGVHA